MLCGRSLLPPLLSSPNFISESVLVGSILGIGLVIVVDQLPKCSVCIVEKGRFLSPTLPPCSVRSPQASIATVLLRSGCSPALWPEAAWLPRLPAPLRLVAVGDRQLRPVGASIASGVELGGTVHAGLPQTSVGLSSTWSVLSGQGGGHRMMSFTEKGIRSGTGVRRL